MSYSFAEEALLASSFVWKKSQQCTLVLHMLVSSPGMCPHPRCARYDDKEPSYALLSLFLRDIRAVPAIDRAREATT
jgi:hypothetical protein